MEIFEWIRLIVGGALLLCGLIIFLIELYGIFHFRFVLNRMHAAAMGDTLGISVSLVGLMIFCGLNFTTLKMMLIVIFLWFASPVSSHLLARLEVTTNEKLKSQCQIYEDIADLEKEIEEEKKKEVGGEKI
ncbi:MAG: monovalent cation/H(+) antiporter subunit G [Lachnospiraceae bacterium]|nr:monovalent cation/H(+) antiporter subunit G [Lachnospiraceae bacterium]